MDTYASYRRIEQGISNDEGRVETEDRRQKIPGRETEKPAPGVNSRADGRQGGNIEQ